MEAMLILVFLVFVILLLAATSKSQRHLFDIHSELGGLRDDLREFLTQSRLEIRQLRNAPVLPSPQPAQAAPPPAPKPEPPAPPPPAPKPEPAPSPLPELSKPQPAPVPEPPKQAPVPELPKPGPAPLPELPKPKPEPVPEFPKPEQFKPQPLPHPTPKSKPEDLLKPAPKPEEPKPLGTFPPLNKAPLPVPDPPVSMRHSDRSQVPVQEPLRTPPPPPVPPAPPQEPRPGFFERHPDLEKFIGENLISKIGIAILVIGIGFFVKYAIDQNWIRPAGRVAIGMLCGGILIGLAHRLQKAYNAFSSVLVGGGLAVCYYTIALAYQDYGLMSQPLAFGIMAALTAFAAVLSLLYDRQEVAIIAMAGGFTAPFLVSNGSGSYVVLFSYLLLLNTGLLIIAYRKAWRLLNGLAFGLTTLLFGGWLATLDPDTSVRVYRGGFFFAAGFYLLFLAINLAHNVSKRKTFIVSDFSILLATTGLFFGGGVYMLEQGDWSGGRGIFAIAMAVLNFCLTSYLARRGRVDKSILYLFIGITLSFVSMAAPLQLSGHSITLFWAAETVVLLWLFLRTRYSILQIGFCIVWCATWISLLMDWNQYFFSPGKLPIVFNRGFLTSLYVAAAHVFLYGLSRRQSRHPEATQAPAYVAPLAGTLAIILLYVTGYTEIWLQFSSRAANHYGLTQYLLCYSLAFVVALDLVRRRALPDLKPVFMMGLFGIGVMAYLACSINVYHAQLSLWQSYGRLSHFSIHWIAAALVVYIALRLLKSLRKGPLSDSVTGLHVFAAIFGLLFVSLETGLLMRILFAADLSQIHRVDDNYIRIGLPIVWGLYSFFLMWQGMRHRDKVLRITSLSIFSITLLKLFIVDIRRLGPGGKIAASCSLGVLLLVVSFMYQRLRRLIVDDKQHGKDEAAQE